MPILTEDRAEQKPSVKQEPQDAEPGPSQAESSRRKTRATRHSRESSSSGRPRSHIVKIESQEHILTANERRGLGRKVRTRQGEDGVHTEEEARAVEHMLKQEDT